MMLKNATFFVFLAEFGLFFAESPLGTGFAFRKR
jgi:hypothetical protein